MRKTSSEQSRKTKIIKVSLIGILTNLLLVVFKTIIGFLSNSIAIILDAVNNLSDALSSVITIVGTKLAGKEADKEHPFGHGRIEYLSAMLISIIILYAGFTALVESIKKIINPEVADYSSITIITISVAVVVKVLLGLYVKKIGKKVNSDSLVNSGEDALLDAVISLSTIVAAFIYLVWDISLEAWLGSIISIIIIKSGFDMLKETLSKILGERVDATLARNIKKTIASYPEVSGAYDLVMNNYGPDSYNGSVHIAVPDTMTVDELDKLTRRITGEVYQKYGVLLTAVGIYSINTKNDEVENALKTISAIVLKEEYVLQLHGFYFNKDDKSIRFDIVVSFDAKSRQEVHDSVLDSVQKLFPSYSIQIGMDIDFSAI